MAGRLLAIVVGSFVAACASPAPVANTSPTAAPGQSSPSPSAVASPAGPSPSPGQAGQTYAPGPAWQSVVDAIKEDGSVSKDTALQAFSLAFGALPGVSLPSGETGTITDGTMPMHWLVSQWAELTSDQQAAAIAAIPELAGVTARVPFVVLASQQRPNAYYTDLANEMIAEIGGRLTSPLVFGLAVEARVGSTVTATAWAETSVLDANGQTKGDPARCLIVVNPTGDALSDQDARLMVAHEAWHCYQGAVLGMQRTWYDRPAPWITEGQAEWVGDTLVPDAPVASGAWGGYLPHPEKPLFQFAYAAIGFYAQLNSSGTDVWGKLVPMLKEPDNASAFTASGAGGDQFLDRWASGFLRDASRGDQWQITGPAITSDYVIPTGLHLSNGGSIPESAAPYANEIAVFQETPDVLATAFTGHARLSDAAGHDYLGQDGGNFCMLQTGCECPGTSPDEPPMLALDGPSPALALTGGPIGASGQLTGIELNDFCQGLAGTWTGTWANDPSFGDTTGTFSMTLTQKGSHFSGPINVEGPTCVRAGTVDGTITGKSLQMGWVFPESVEPVLFEATLAGKHMSGTWHTISCGPPYVPAEMQIPIFGSFEATKQK